MTDDTLANQMERLPSGACKTPDWGTLESSQDNQSSASVLISQLSASQPTQSQAL